jgi:hypothetical protein
MSLQNNFWVGVCTRTIPAGMPCNVTTGNNQRACISGTFCNGNMTLASVRLTFLTTNGHLGTVCTNVYTQKLNQTCRSAWPYSACEYGTTCNGMNCVIPQKSTCSWASSCSSGNSDSYLPGKCVCDRPATSLLGTASCDFSGNNKNGINTVLAECSRQVRIFNSSYHSAVITRILTLMFTCRLVPTSALVYILQEMDQT